VRTCLATQRALDGFHHARSRSFSALAKSIYFSRPLDKSSGARLQDRKKRLLKLIARTRADGALALTAAMISPVDPATGTASDRSPNSNSSSLIA
jgi:hypothetical protein